MKYDVVIVDTGYNLSHPKLKDKIMTGIQIVRKHKGYEILDLLDDNDDVGHGTAISNIIYTHDSTASIFMIKVFDRSLEADEELLYYALNYILSNVDCKLINLSLGISLLNNLTEMRNICNEINQKGIAIIAAFDNDGSVSFPAAFDSVIGVTNDEHCYHNDEYFVINNPIVNVGARGNRQKVAWLDGKYSIGQGNSYACAHICGISMNLLRKNPKCNKDSLMEMLKMYQKTRKESYSYNYASTTPDLEEPVNYKNVAIFPFNKEMHALVRFQSLLSFKIIAVYDVKYSFNVGSSTDKLLNIITDNPFTIKKIDDINWEAIDTLIIGHTRSLLNSIMNDDEFLVKLLNDAQERKKNVYSFDELPVQFKNNEQFRSPNLFNKYIPIPYGKLYRQTKPILAVFGTSSQQGKFTLQLMLREKMIKKGYTVGQLSTEPSGLLFGMDENFHFGYDSGMNISRFDLISCLNSILFAISQKNVDIIITGCQSQTILTEEGNLFYYPIPQVEFLFGVLPDAVVLVINPFDELEEIKRTIIFLESCVECKVLAIVMFPMRYNVANMFFPKEHVGSVEFKQLADDIVFECGIPVFLLDDDMGIELLVELIEEFFGVI